MEFVIYAKGHPLIKATHKSTFEITKDNYLTERGDCIIGICATHSVKDLPKEIKERLKKGEKILIILECEGEKDTVIAKGHPKLTFKSNNSIVIRKSSYVDDRTLAIYANKAAKDLNRKLIENLRKGKNLKVIIKVI